MPYLNLDLGYFTHRKTSRLVGLLGRGAAELPIRVWSYCGTHHPESGSLAGYSAQEIEAVVGWWGKPGELVSALVKVGFLEAMPDGYQCHDWLEHEGHLKVFHERAKAASKVRWDRYAARSNASSNAKQPVEAMPHTLPYRTNHTKPNQPTKKERGRFAPPTPQEVCAYASTIGFTLDGEQFCNYYASKGWVVGKSPMRDWKAAVRTWKLRSQEARHGSRRDVDPDRAAALRALEQPVDVS